MHYYETPLNIISHNDMVIFIVIIYPKLYLELYLEPYLEPYLELYFENQYSFKYHDKNFFLMKKIFFHRKQ